MIIVHIVVGALLGALAVPIFQGLILGGAVGFLLHRTRELRQRLKKLEEAPPMRTAGPAEIREPGPSPAEQHRTTPPAAAAAAADAGLSPAEREQAERHPGGFPDRAAAAADAGVSPAEREQAADAPAEAAADAPAEAAADAPEPERGRVARVLDIPEVKEALAATPRAEALEEHPSARQPEGATRPLAPQQAEADHAPPQPDPPGHAPAESPDDPVTRLLRTAKAWTLTGNVSAKAGVLVSLIGLGFLIREASERGLIRLTIEMRLVAVAVFGLALLALGWRLRGRRPVYGLSLQGGGIATLYLTLYAAFAVYDLLAAPLALSSVVAITVGAGVLAVAQDSRSMAVLGIIGGFLAPVLAYSQPDDHILVFGFYTILNAAILAVAWFKTWPELNLLGFGLTFGIAAFWLSERHAQDDWGSAQPFVALFAVMYMAIPVLFAAREATGVRGPWTAPLVFGTPFAALGLQQLLIGHTEYGLAISALALAAVHAALASVTRRMGESSRELAEAHLSLGAAFTAIAVPLALDANYTSAVWALQGVALLVFGLRRTRLLPLASGAGLLALAGAAFVVHLDESLPYPASAPLLANEHFLGAAVLAAAGAASGRLLYGARGRFALGALEPAAQIALAWAACWWLAAGLLEIGHQAPDAWLSPALAFVVFSFGAATLSSRRLKWPHLDGLGLLLLPALAGALYAALVVQAHPLDRYGWAAWPASIAVYYVCLRRREDLFPRLQSAQHAGGYWLLAILAGFEAFWQTDQFADGAWPFAAGTATLLALVGGTLLGRRLLAWPLSKHWRSYIGAGAGPVLALTAALIFLAIALSPGAFPPLPHLPLLNPLALLTALLLAVAFAWKRRAAAESDKGPAFESLVGVSWAPLLAAAGVVFATMSAARAVHHWLDVPFDAESLFGSTALQSSLSIIWASMALGGMVAGVRLADRAVWTAGASFMGVVVVKLFLVDLSSLSALGRVVSFIGVGVLLLVVGYLAPVPPPQPADSAPRQPDE